MGWCNNAAACKKIKDLIKQPIEGIHNYRTQKKLTKYDILVLIKDIFQKDIEIFPKKTANVDKTESEAIWCENDYLTQLIELKEWMDLNKKMYEQYFN